MEVAGGEKKRKEDILTPCALLIGFLNWNTRTEIVLTALKVKFVFTILKGY